MKIKFLAVLGLAAVAGLGGCKSAANTNVANITANTANMAVNTMTTSTPMSTTMASDPAAKSAVEAALAKKGITGVTVDATADSITLRGTVADKTKMTEAMMAATEVGKRKVVNQLTSTK